MSKIVKSFVKVSIETDTGYESNEEWGPNHGSQQLKNALVEIVRLLTFNGEGQQACNLVRRAHDAAQQDADARAVSAEAACGGQD